MSKVNILVFPAGEMIAVELHDALSSNVNFEIYGASSVDRHGSYIFRNYYGGLPLISDKSFLSAFNALIDKWNIKYIFPTHDDVALYFGTNSEQIHATPINCHSETVSILRDKKKIYELFRGESFCPEVYTHFNNYPIFMKPRVGQGGIGSKKIDSPKELESLCNVDEYVFCEFLPGEELSVDCLTDSKGDVRIISPRTRERVLSGITVRGSDFLLSDEIRQIAFSINRKLRFCGLWFFQLKRAVNGRFKLLEIASRCASSMCCTRALGYNLPLLSLYCAMGKDITVLQCPYHVTMDRALISRYKTDLDYDVVYLDFDDTLVIRGRVNLAAIRLLYQFLNDGKRVVLLTHHSDDIFKALSNYAISGKLFTKIIKVEEGRAKSDYINEARAIFIDNSYKERESVFRNIGIPVFDVDTIDVLQNWSC